MTRITAFVFVLMCCMVAGCSEKSAVTNEPGGNGQPEPNPLQLTATELSIVDNTNEFAFKLFKEVCENTSVDSNVFLSPISASYALTMTANGANGPTYDSMIQTLQLGGLSLADINEGYHNLTHILTHADTGVTFTIANSFWSRQGKQIQPQYVATAQDYYDARVQEIDIYQPWAVDTINQWVKDNTNNKISSIVRPPLEFASLLLNAIYFKGNWRYEFDTTHTYTQPFHLPNGTTKDWDIMYLAAEDIMQGTEEQPVLNPDVKVLSNSEVNMIALPYGDEGFEMLVLTPPYQSTVDDLLAGLSSQKLDSWVRQLTVDRFMLALPRMKFSYEILLNDRLKAMGMNIAFDPSRCDLSRMFVDGVGWIDKVRQKTFVQVDEKGTEAAAVTSVVTVDSMPPYIDGTRPFLFIIRESQCGAILFMAKIADPLWES